MRVRGRRRCQNCDTTWSYFDRGEVACPRCGSLRSVGTESEPRLHTDSPVELDLVPARRDVDRRSLDEVAETAADVARRYVLARGFIADGDLLPLDDVVLAAAELRHAADAIRRGMRPTDPEEAYFLTLLSGADDGERPASVPESMRPARGLGSVDGVKSYRRDLGRWLGEDEDRDASAVLDRVRQHERRIAALEGRVPPADADRLVAAVRAVGDYLRGETDASALERARRALAESG